MTLRAISRTASLGDLTIPPELEAHRPPEWAGLPRDAVRLMVSEGSDLRHRRFRDLADELEPGDLVVVNNSKTLPASVVIDEELVVNFSTRQPGGFHVVEPRRRDGPASTPWDEDVPRHIRFDGGSIDLLAPFPGDAPSARLWLARVDVATDIFEFLLRWGRPIRYRHVSAPIPLDEYQTVFAAVPGSAEMPSAGRPFTTDLVTRLVRSGVGFATVTLHTGVSSLEAGEEPYPEWFEIAEDVAARINETRARRGRVIAIGTTVVRAVESAADTDGRVHPTRAWTDLVIDPGFELRAFDGLVTGWHEPHSTHLAMLEAFCGRSQLVASYETALDRGYLWHEFGDSHLILRQ